MSGHFAPHDPTILGMGWFPTTNATEPVDEGPAWVQRLPTRAAEPIESVKMDAQVNPTANPSRALHTLIEVVPEGEEFQGTQQQIDLPPNKDGAIGNWTSTGWCTVLLVAACAERA
jgi:hypothetical protein